MAVDKKYAYGFVSSIDTDVLPCGLNEEVVAAISQKKNEPQWMLDFRLQAYSLWKGMCEPVWGNFVKENIDFNSICYYAAPKKRPQVNSLEEADPELLRTFERLGIPLAEQAVLANVAMDVVFDSVSINTAFHEDLERSGVIFCSISEAVQKYPNLVKKYLASVVPVQDSFYSALNSAVFSDGSFAYIPKGVRCPVDLSTYFRLNNKSSGQFERTLLIAEEGSAVNYLEGCTAPAYDTNQLHAAVVELIAKKDAEIKYSTVQNWYAGDPVTGKGGVYNFVTKRGRCEGEGAKISWTQVEAGSAITWKYPSTILEGDDSSSEFYSVSLTEGHMQADTGTRMVHIGKNTRSTILSKSISSGHSKNTYRGLVRILPSAENARNYTSCDSLLIGDSSSTHTFPLIEDKGALLPRLEHEASISQLDEKQLFYMRSRGFSLENAISLLVSGFCGRVLEKLPLEFAQEAKNLLSLKIEGALG